jgi:hypothetical protein
MCEHYQIIMLDKSGDCKRRLVHKINNLICEQVLSERSEQELCNIAIYTNIYKSPDIAFYRGKLCGLVWRTIVWTIVVNYRGKL